MWFCRQHFLEFPQGMLAKNFEKLVQCDAHLNFVSQQPEIILDSPHFDTQPDAFENLVIEGSTSSETDSKGPRNCDQIKLAGLRTSMSLSDFIGHIEHCLSEQITCGDPSFCDGRGRPGFQEMLEEIAQHLLNDNQVIAAS